MERKEGWINARYMRFFGAVMAVMLCSTPVLWGETIPNDGTEYNIPGDFGPIISGDLFVYGTVNLLPDADILVSVYAYNTSVLKIKGGNVGFAIDVQQGAQVTVYGTNFNLGEGTFEINGFVTGSYENGDSIDLYIACQSGATVTLAAPGSEPPPNELPIADAGPDLTVYIMDVASTIIQGTADDPDELDTLLYKWLEGGVEFTLSAPVGENGEAPLDLGTILPQYLGIGTHTLTLEVTDGKETVSDYMVLEIFNIYIDIKPGSSPNTINLGSNGVVPVAILSSNVFDATAINPDNVFLAGSGVAVRGKGNKSLANQEDVNGDGLMDLVVKVETENLDPGQFQDGTAILKIHETEDPESPVLYEATDEITIVPPE